MNIENNHNSPNTSTQQRRKSANKVTLIGSMANLLLSALKLIAGIVGRSHAMVADAIHSLSDLGTDVAVLVGIYLASQPRDKGHNYGHGKYETFATLIIALTLLSVGVGIGWNGISKIIAYSNGEILHTPGMIAFGAAVLSIIVKEALFRYTKKSGIKLKSSSLVANAHHHRSDALSSFGTGIGIAGAIILGDKWVILDPLAAVVVSVLILKEAISIGYVSINDLLEAALPEHEQEKILAIANETTGVIEPHNLKTRRIGCTIALDLHIRVIATITVREGHYIAHTLQDALVKEFGSELFCSIHVEPEESQSYSQS